MQIKINGLNLIIRNSAQQDYRYCYALTKNNMLIYFTKYWGGWKSEVFRRDFNIKNTKIILRNDKRVGYYVLEQKENFTYVDNVQISPLLRGKGIGTYIMKLIEQQTLKSKKHIIRLTVFKDNPAKKLYERLDYKIRKDKGTSILMEKKI